MATATEVTASQNQRIVLHGVSWQAYQSLLESEESRRGSVRMTYDRGRLVVKSLSIGHEIAAERLGILIRMVSLGLGLNCLGVGRTTLTREDTQRGKEPDTAFYLANEPRVRGRLNRDLDLALDPPPDLAVEVEISHRDPAMLEVYAALGVPEVWLYDGQALRALALDPGNGYREVAVSPALPMLPLHEIPRWLERAETAGETAMMAEFLDWVRADLAPRQAPE